MLDFLRTLTDLPPDSPVHISDEDIALARQRRELLDQARQQAQDGLQQATEEAEALRRAAFQEGYGQGVLQAATDMGRTLIESQTLMQHLRQQLAIAARQLLGTVLCRDELLDEIIGDWLSDQAAVELGQLQLILPDRCQREDASLVARLRRRWCAEGGAPHRIRIEYHPRECYLIRLADQVLEFDTDALQVRLSPMLLAALEQMPQEYRRLDASAREALANLLKTYVTDESHIHQAGTSQP